MQKQLGGRPFAEYGSRNQNIPFSVYLPQRVSETVGSSGPALIHEYSLWEDLEDALLRLIGEARKDRISFGEELGDDTGCV